MIPQGSLRKIGIPENRQKQEGNEQSTASCGHGKKTKICTKQLEETNGLSGEPLFVVLFALPV